jgi:hypothetical protein
MQQGAEQAARALDTVGQKAERTGRQINVSTEAIERKLDAIVDGIAAQNRMMEESGRKTQAQLKETERQLDSTKGQVEKMGQEVTKVSGVMAAMEEKFRALGKAAVGMFAADVFAKVVGFNSAMDALSKVSNAAAEGIREIGIQLLGLEDVIEQHNIIGSLNDQLEKLQQQRAAGYFQVNVAGQTVELHRPRVEGIEQQIQMTKMVLQAQQTIRDLEAAARSGSTLQSQRFTTGVGVARPTEEQAAQAAQRVLEDLRLSLEQLAKAGEKAAAGTEAAVKGFQIQDTMPDSFRYRADTTAIRFGAGAAPDRRGTLADQAQIELLRRIALNTGDARARFALGGVPEETFFPQIVPAMGGILPEESKPFYERGRGAQAATPSALEQRYAVENIAQDFTQQFYGSLKSSLLTGDFSDFGRQVTNMIGSSLIDALVAAPFQEAMSTLVQALLSGIRGGLGIQAAPSGGGGGAPSAEMRSMTVSTSNAQYRSQRQQFDDSARRRPV